MMHVIRILPVVFAFCCIAGALYLRFSRRCGIRNPKYTQATVVSRIKQVSYRHGSAVEQYAPVMRYMTEQGEQTAPARSFVPDWQFRYREGEQVEICYDEKHPGIFQICRSSGREVRSMLLFAVGITTLLAYAVLWVQYY